MSEPISPERLRRRATARLLQKVQHALPVYVLVQEGAHALSEGAEGWHRWLAITEVVVSVAVLISLAAAFKEHAKHRRLKTAPHLHTGIDWIDIFLGALCFTEAWAKYMENGHIARPTLVLGVVMILFGLFGGKYLAWRRERFGR